MIQMRVTFSAILPKITTYEYNFVMFDYNCEHVYNFYMNYQKYTLKLDDDIAGSHYATSSSSIPNFYS